MNPLRFWPAAVVLTSLSIHAFAAEIPTELRKIVNHVEFIGTAARRCEVDLYDFVMNPVHGWLQPNRCSS